MIDATILVAALRDPASTKKLDAKSWTALLTIARAEQLIGTLAHRLRGQDMPVSVAAILEDVRTNAEYQKRTALWEADCARRALAGYPGKVVLMKGTAYVAAGLKAGEGRHIGDLDIMVAQADIPQVEALLLGEGGWEWVKEDAYDDAYYRNHMHELPPMIHKERDRMIDVHHTILPLTARPRPDAGAMLGDAIKPSPLQGRGLGEGAERADASVGVTQTAPSPNPSSEGEGNSDLFIFAPTDMVIHCAAHLIADGDLSGGLRNLWDMHCLLGEFGSEEFWPALKSRAHHHQLWPAVHCAARLAYSLYGTAIPKEWQSWNRQDKWYIARLTARDNWGRSTRKFIRLIFYMRSHWLRMPPLMLMRHLWVKWRRG
jgi:Uncharacterised nucleotidyltransferase